MKDTGHIPMAERPETFNDLLVEFLAETGPAEEKEAGRGRVAGRLALQPEIVSSRKPITW